MDPLSIIGLVTQLVGKHASDPTHSDVTQDANAVGAAADAQIAALKAQLSAAQTEAEHWRSLATMMLQARGLVPSK